MAKRQPNKEEREFMSRVADLGCIACKKDGYESPAEIHHIRKFTGLSVRPDHKYILPLCPSHHRFGKVSVHMGKRKFEFKYGTQDELYKELLERLKCNQENQGIF